MTQEELERVKRAAIRKYPNTLGLALYNVKLELSNEVSTAAVVGEKDDKGNIQVKCIKFNPEFLDLLTFSEKVFVISHEALHIAFKHFARSIKKPEKDAKRKYEEYCKQEQDPVKRERMKIIYHKRYQNIWNIATDACINAFLKEDGFSFPKDVKDPKTGEKMEFVDMKEGLVKSAEKIYDYLVQKQEEKEKQKNQSQGEENKQKQGDNNQNQEESNQKQGDNNQSQEESNQSQENNNQNQDEQQEQNDQTNSGVAPGGSNDGFSNLDDIDIDNYKGFDSHESWTGEDNTNEMSEEETSSNENNEDEEEINEEEIMKQDKPETKDKKEKSLKSSFSKIRSPEGIGKYVPFKPVLSWKRLLVGNLETTVERWGNRRASRFNPNPRIEERTEEKGASVEVLLDVSGSISVNLLRGFLLQLYPILEAAYTDDDITIKVGCFSEYFSGWQILKSKSDIEKFSPKVGGGTDFEVAATSFTKDPGRTIKKIVFTDGRLGSPQQTRIPDIIWIVFGDNMNFVPVGGRIIKVSKEEYKEMINQNLFFDEDINMIEDNSDKTIKR